MQIPDRKGLRLQPHDLQKVQPRVLLDLPKAVHSLPLPILQLLWMSGHAVLRRKGYEAGAL